MQRTFAIGDIHGGLRALKQLMDLIKPQPEDTFIFLGDYVDGWSESAQVIDYLILMDKKYKCFFIKGNHDAWCEDWLKTGRISDVWYVHGGKETMKSYSEFDDNDKWNHISFFEQMRYYYVDQSKLFVHAGFTSIHGVFHETQNSNFYWDRTLWEMALVMDKKIEKDSALYPKRLKHYAEIYVGHTPTTNYSIDVPMNAVNVWNVDTGAAFLGKLSAINIETKEFFQSDTVRLLYPDEKGRNK
jgi:serine/threonine protein phosphatase 1